MAVSHLGPHQLSSRSKCITAGTSNMRITVASNNSAAIMPKAMYFIITISEKPNAPHTTIMITAAAVMIDPVWAVPYTIASSVDLPLPRASTMRETKKTS